MQRSIEVMPSASRLTGSLRDIGYEFVTAVADLVDNSVSAGAENVRIHLLFDGEQSRVVISDDGRGMSPKTLNEAMRFGSRRGYESGDLGKFGLGLKTASLSQCRRLTVVTRIAPDRRRLHARVLDLDHILETDRWEVLAPPPSSLRPAMTEPLSNQVGTVVVWENLDRVLSYADPSSGWARRRLDQLADATSEYVGMVFHRFLAGEVPGTPAVKISVNDSIVQPWDPFGRDEPAHDALPPRRFTLGTSGGTAEVIVRPYVLPPRGRFSSPAAFERLAGPLKWNRQQGFYVYRSHRLLQSGGWCGLRTLDEHTKLARVAVDFGPELDEQFQVNVAKMRVGLPPELRQQLQKPIAEVCHWAQQAYRVGEHTNDEGRPNERPDPARGQSSALGLALRSAALVLGEAEWEALERIAAHLRQHDPVAATALGL